MIKRNWKTPVIVRIKKDELMKNISTLAYSGGGGGIIGMASFCIINLQIK